MSPYIVENGQMVSRDIELDDQWLFGVGAFTTALYTDEKLLLWEHHLDRLKRSAEYIWGPQPKLLRHLEELPQIIKKWVDEQDSKDWGIRINLTAGKEQNVKIFVLPRPYEKMSGAVTVITSKLWKPASPFPSFLKRPDYLLARKGFEESKKTNAKEVVFLSENREITEAAYNNVFLVSKDTLYTPPIGPHVLEGVTRRFVLELAEENGVRTIERTIRRSQLSHMDAAFLTNCLNGILPIKRWDQLDLDSENKIIRKLTEGMPW